MQPSAELESLLLLGVGMVALSGRRNRYSRGSVVVGTFPKEGRDGDEQAAYATAGWLQRADLNGSLESFSIRR
jgi:hypothetical protein